MVQVCLTWNCVKVSCVLRMISQEGDRFCLCFVCDIRTIPGVDQHLVIGMHLPLNLLPTAVWWRRSSWNVKLVQLQQGIQPWTGIANLPNPSINQVHHNPNYLEGPGMVGGTPLDYLVIEEAWRYWTRLLMVSMMASPFSPWTCLCHKPGLTRGKGWHLCTQTDGGGTSDRHCSCSHQFSGAQVCQPQQVCRKTVLMKLYLVVITVTSYTT